MAGAVRTATSAASDYRIDRPMATARRAPEAVTACATAAPTVRQGSFGRRRPTVFSVVKFTITCVTTLVVGHVVGAEGARRWPGLVSVRRRLGRLSGFLSRCSADLVTMNMRASQVMQGASQVTRSFNFFYSVAVFRGAVVVALHSTSGSRSCDAMGGVGPVKLGFTVGSTLDALD